MNNTSIVSGHELTGYCLDKERENPERDSPINPAYIRTTHIPIRTHLQGNLLPLTRTAMQNMMPRHLLLQRHLERNCNFIRRILGNVPIATNLGRIQRQNRAPFTTPDPGLFIRVREADVRQAGEKDYPSKSIVNPEYHDRRFREGRGGGAYCIAGALCLPPSNFAGMTEYDAFPLTEPRFSISEPAVPAWEDSVKPGSRAQHSRMDLLLRAPMTVTLRVLRSGAVAVAAMAAVLVRRVVRSLSEIILCVYVL